LVFWTTLFGVVASDYASKAWIRANYSLGESRPVLGDLLRFVHWRNSGAAFGLLQGATPYLALISVGCVLLAVLIYPRMKGQSAIVPVSLGLIAGGALGNLIDRVRFGGVTDFISFRFFSPIFNIADSGIVIGAVLMGLFFLVSPKGSVDR
jgi:signal peptidase II